MNKITAEEARKNQQDYINTNKEAFERPARECLEKIYECIEAASKSGESCIMWSDTKYTLILLSERMTQPTKLSRYIMEELRHNGYSAFIESNATLRISW